MTIGRKYRGALRLAPLRQAAAASLALPSSDGAALDGAFEAEAAARKAGFTKFADEILSVLDARLGRIRCEDCGEILGEGSRRRVGGYLDQCRACAEHIRVTYLKQRLGPKKLRRALRGPRQPGWYRLPQNWDLWPWRDVKGWNKKTGGRYRMVVQRSWAHLAKQLPDPDRLSELTPEERAAFDKLLRDERKRRREAATGGSSGRQSS